MDIKLKNYNKIRLSTALVFTLCVIFFLAALTSGVLSIRTLSSADYSSGSIDDYLLRPNYAESEEYQREYAEFTMFYTCSINSKARLI